MSLVINKFMKIQKASSSLKSKAEINVLAMKFIPWQYPTSGSEKAMAYRTRLNSSWPSTVFIFSEVCVLFRSLEISSLTLWLSSFSSIESRSMVSSNYE